MKALLPEPIMEPELPWERSGDVDNVVFIQGAILQADGTIYATYGAADRCVGGAHLSTDRLLHACAPLPDCVSAISVARPPGARRRRKRIRPDRPRLRR